MQNRLEFQIINNGIQKITNSLKYQTIQINGFTGQLKQITCNGETQDANNYEQKVNNYLFRTNNPINCKKILIFSLSLKETTIHLKIDFELEKLSVIEFEV